MAEPFSIVAGAAGLADVCLRTIKFIKAARAGTHEIDDDIQTLCEELNSLNSANDIVVNTYQQIAVKGSDTTLQHIFSAHWKATSETLAGCKKIVEQLEELLRFALDVGSNRYGKTNQFRKWLKHESKEKEFIDLRKKLNLRQSALQLILEATNVSVLHFLSFVDILTQYISGLSPEHLMKLHIILFLTYLDHWTC